MKLLVVVTDNQEAKLVPSLLRQAGVQDYAMFTIHGQGFATKPSMKLLRQLKGKLDLAVKEQGPFDYLIALGETAARLALDTSAVNINRLRGRDFEYAYGCREKSSNRKQDS